ncbi:AMP-binding protein [Alkalihalobacterium alkalinitrilicum]|uniref:AMP-binding protein n=1 Tax=Alkalihalobacterium alkalinitrilicum TaxID=427920 RepID=UPI000994E6AE|nr:AMP-binding protein [Alkalihalobacterium alkalinitrilicum]
MHIGHILSRMHWNTNSFIQNKVALKLEEDAEWTYEQLDSVSTRYANTLRELGVRKGDRVGILLFNSLEYCGLYFAIAKLGAIAVRLNFRLTSEEYEFILNDSGTTVLCFHSSLKEKLEPIKQKVGVQHYIALSYDNVPTPDWAFHEEVLQKGSSQPIRETIEISDPLMLMYTSGTTGRPKGALWSHDNTLWFNAMQIMKWQINDSTTTLVSGPLYHVGALEDIAFPTLLAGGTVIMMKSGNFQIERTLSIIENNKVTDCLLFPFMIYEMLNMKNEEDYQLKNLSTIYSGGDPVLPWALEQLKGRYPHIGLVQVYGLTEGTPIATSLDAHDVQLKGHTVGKPMPLTEVKIVDDNRNELPIGEVGEICIKSPVVCNGYWNRPEVNAVTFVDGWCYTGDLGVVDEDGFVSIAGRKKDMIRSGGENIYPVEIENVLIKHPDIIDVAIIGIPDEKFIEAVCAVVIRKETSTITENDVINYCKQYLASYKKPKVVCFTDTIPRTASGKVQKFILREQYTTISDMNIDLT